MSDSAYVYMYFAETDTARPYYIGKTRSRRRCWRTSGRKDVPVPSPNDVVILDCSSHDEACSLEQHLIHKWGRAGIDQGGVLMNKALGGRHSSYGYRHTEQAKEKMSRAASGTNNNFFGRTHSHESRAKMSQSRMGLKPSPEARAKRSESMKKVWAKRKASND